MTNATLPTSVLLKTLAGLVNFPVDQYSAVIPLGQVFASINGTNYTEFKNKKTGAAYGAVAASTNLRIYGLELATIGANWTTLQIGYDNDGAGTGFTVLFDLGATIPSGSQNLSNIITGLLTVPTGKHLTLKIVATAIANHTITAIGLETN